MTPDKTIGDGTILVSCLVGVIAQTSVGRRLRVLPKLNYGLALGLFAAYLLTDGDLLPFIYDVLPSAFIAFVHSFLFLWFFAMGATAVLLFFRGRVPAFRSDRREMLRRSTAVLCAAPAAALAFGVITRKDFHVKEVTVTIPNLPQDLHGLRLLQLSDIHMGAFFGANDLARVVDQSNALPHDLAFVTGDLITTKWDPLDKCLLELKRLRSPNGIWGCMGNHEMYAKVQGYTEERAKELGMDFLRYRSAGLKFGNSRVNLVGVDYQRRHEPYLVGVEQFVRPDDFNLLLSHNPDVFPVAAKQGFHLTLAGHTHGGQINVEILGENLNPADFITPYTKGLYTEASSAIYVTAGLGTIGMPVRLGAPPEITLLRLCRS